MTINEIAETLTRCAKGKCIKCNYKALGHYATTRLPCDVANCQTDLIKAMAKEVRKIAEEMENELSEM